MGQVEKIFVVSIVGLVLLILAITVFGPGHKGAQACIVPPGTQRAGVENPLHPAGLETPRAEKETPVPGGEMPAAVVVKGGEAIPAALPEKPRTGLAEGGEPKKEVQETTPPAPQDSPVAEPAPAREEQRPPVQPAPSYRPRPAIPFVVVKKGETLGEILQRELGSAHKYLDLVLQFNEGMDPDHLRAGQKIWLPPNLPQAHSSQASRKAPVPTPGARPAPSRAPRTYKVKKGDSLWKIATRFFGKKNVLEGIRKIKRANRDKDLDLLPAGMVLAIPR